MSTNAWIAAASLVLIGVVLAVAGAGLYAGIAIFAAVIVMAWNDRQAQKWRWRP